MHPRKLATFLLVLVMTSGHFSASSRADVLGVDGKPLHISSSLASELEAIQRQLVASGNIEDCRREAARITQLHGDLPHPDLLVSLWLFQADRADRAKQLMEELARNMESPRPDVHAFFANQARREGRLFDAWTHTCLAVEARRPENWSPDFADTFATSIRLDQADLARQRQDWPTARALYEQTAASGDDAVRIQLGLGHVSFAEGDWGAAEAFFRSAESLSRESVIPEFLLASLHEAAGRIADAESWYRRALVENAEHSDRIRLVYARWLLQRNRASDALQLLQDSSWNSGRSESDAQLIQALAMQMNGDHNAAAGQLSGLSRQDPSNVFVSNRLALSLVESPDEGQRGRALQIASTNTRRAPNSIQVACALAWIQFRLGDLDAAARSSLAIAGSGAKLDRDSAYFLARIFASLDRVHEAAELLHFARNGTGEFYYSYELDSDQDG